MRNVRLSGAWLIAGVSLCMLGFLLVTGQPFTAKAQEPKRIQYKIVEVLPDAQNMQTTLNEFSRMLKKSASGVLASFRPSTYPRGYASALHSLRPCWTAFLSILREGSPVVPHLRTIEVLVYQNSFSTAC